MTRNGRYDTQALLSRLQRAYQGLLDETYTVHRVPDGWRVVNTHTAYTVRRTDDGWTCACPDHQNRGLPCKHIFMVYLHAKAQAGMPLDDAFAALRDALQSREETPRDFDERLTFAVQALEGPSEVTRMGAHTWQVAVRGMGDADGTFHVSRNEEGAWACDACGPEECEHALMVQLASIMARAHVFPLRASLILQEQRRQRNGHRTRPNTSAPMPPREETLARTLQTIRQTLESLMHTVETLQTLMQTQEVTP